MKISLHTSSFGEILLENAISRTHELGYGYIELAADISNTPHFMAHEAGIEQQMYLEKQLIRHNVQLLAIDIGGWDLPLLDTNMARVIERVFKPRKLADIRSVFFDPTYIKYP